MCLCPRYPYVKLIVLFLPRNPEVVSTHAPESRFHQHGYHVAHALPDITIIPSRYSLGVSTCARMHRSFVCFSAKPSLPCGTPNESPMYCTIPVDLARPLYFLRRRAVLHRVWRGADVRYDTKTRTRRKKTAGCLSLHVFVDRLASSRLYTYISLNFQFCSDEKIFIELLLCQKNQDLP